LQSACNATELNSTELATLKLSSVQFVSVALYTPLSASLSANRFTTA